MPGIEAHGEPAASTASDRPEGAGLAVCLSETFPRINVLVRGRLTDAPRTTRISPALSPKLRRLEKSEMRTEETGLMVHS